MTFSQILEELLKEDSNPQESSSENNNFHSEKALGPLYISTPVTYFDPRAAATRRYGLKAKSRFERKARPKKPAVYLSRSNLNEAEATALRFLLGHEVFVSDNGAIAETDIRRLYRHRALELHPDRPGGGKAVFQELQLHYDVLIAALKRVTKTAA